MRALSIRQPWAELILRGIKSIEVRSIRTNIRERVYIYASLGRTDSQEEDRIARECGIDVEALPRGVVVGSVELAECRPLMSEDSAAAGFSVWDGYRQFAWCLERPKRLSTLRKPKGKPQPVWFNPF